MSDIEVDLDVAVVLKLAHRQHYSPWPHNMFQKLWRGGIPQGKQILIVHVMKHIVHLRQT